MPGLRAAVFVVLVAAAAYAFLGRRGFSSEGLLPSLKGQVAVVTGGSRGIGKGLAVGLGEAGATVYVTARTVTKGSANSAGIGGKSQVGSAEETCELVVKAGGRCVALPVDSANDTQLEELFERVIKEQGRLDILVNNAFSAVSALPRTMGKAFWEKGTDMWDTVNHVGLRSHYLASVHAARHMSKAKTGLIVNVGSMGGLNYIFDVAYGIGKAAMDRMANDMAIELATENIAMVSLWPGFVKTENIEDGALEDVSVERRGKQPGMPSMNTTDLLATPLAETPLFSGRAVAALARDPRKMDFTGRVVMPSVMAWGYGFVDERGVRTPPVFSLKGMLAPVLRSALASQGLWQVTGGAFAAGQELSDRQRFFWNTLPDFTFPGLLVKLAAGAPNL